MGIEKAIVALVLAILNIVNLIWGVDFFGAHAEIIIGFVVSLLSPIFVYLVPNR
jgi:hypothetical protein